jgi:hypothetical protein
MVRFWSQRWRVGFWIYYLLRVVLFFGEVERFPVSLEFEQFCLEDVGVEVKLFSCFCLSSKLSAAAEQKE